MGVEQEHDGVLEAFGQVNRHQGDRGRVLVVVVEAGLQSDFFQISGQGAGPAVLLLLVVVLLDGAGFPGWRARPRRRDCPLHTP